MNENTTLYWEKLQQMFRQSFDSISRQFERILPRFLKQIGSSTLKKTKSLLDSSSQASSILSFNRMLKDGPTKDTYLLGEFDREEIEKIIDLANKSNVCIAVSEKIISDDTTSNYRLSQQDLNLMREQQKQIEKNNQKINKIEMSEMSSSKKAKKIAKIQNQNTLLQNVIASIYQEKRKSTYTVMVNASHSRFIEKIKDNILDHDTKEALKKAQEEKIDRLKFDEVFKDFKNLEKSYRDAKEKTQKIDEILKDEQNKYDQFFNKYKDDPKYKEKIQTLSKRLSELKAEWLEQSKIEQLAKEALEKQTFSGELSLKNIKENAGNFSTSMDRFDTIHFLDGYTSFTMSPESYYNMFKENIEQLQNYSYSAFKLTKDSNVEVICSFHDSEKFIKMARKYENIYEYKIHNDSALTDDIKNVYSWSLPLLSEDKIQTNLELINKVHSKNNAEYFVTVSEKNGNLEINVQSNISFQKYQEETKTYFNNKIKHQEEERDKHIKEVKENEILIPKGLRLEKNHNENKDKQHSSKER